MNPVLADVTRSGFTEGVHRGSLMVLAPDGTSLLELGTTRTPMFPRSSSKPLQTTAMVRAGLSLPPGDLALACASHSGQAEHVDRVLDLLDRYGFTEDDLHCPADLPSHEHTRERLLAAGGQRRRAAMNCSGKHAGMLATCATAGWPAKTYTDPAHELQRAVVSTVEEFTGERVAATGVDGCGAPVLAYSLSGLATAFARLAGGDHPAAEAMRAHPYLVAGQGREDTILAEDVPGLLIKGGAEGVHAFALPDGTACALKIDDGGARARTPVLLGVLDALGVTLTDRARELSEELLYGGGEPVGAVRLHPGVLDPLC